MTVFQKQCLLAYLGYYDGQIDGKWGPLTQAATEAFQGDYGLHVDGVYGDGTHAKAAEIIASKEMSVAQKRQDGGVPSRPADPGDNGFWKDIKYFSRSEFRCKCGDYHKPYCNGFPVEPAEKLVRLLDRAREDLGTPGDIISAIRCPQHNADSGGVANSRHKNGWAVDIVFRGKTPAQMEAYFKACPETAYCYQIKDSSGKLCGDVHVDVVL